ncbi:PD-(D/E)XK nuclease family protein [Fredinandcohnia humi]
MSSVLNESPMFQLSLSSKELFHSNFLSWIISNYKEEFSGILSKYILNLKNDNLNILTVKREEKNTDITIYFSDDRGNVYKLIIENKVKSIPAYSQLLSYTSSEKNEYYVLLSLSEPSFQDKNKIYIKEYDKTWSYINYSDLIGILNIANETITGKNYYHSQIVADYTTMIKEIRKLLFRDNSRKSRYYFYSEDGKKQIDELREVRLHDFFLKLQHEKIAGDILKKLKIAKPSLNYVPNQKWELSKAGQVFVGSGFTRGSGLSEVKYVLCERLKSPIILGIQIQGNQFRLFVEAYLEISQKIAQELEMEKVWFNFEDLNENPFFGRVEYPVQNNKKFNTFGGTFNYKYLKLKDIPIDELIDIVIDYVMCIHEKKDYIIKVIDRIL